MVRTANSAADAGTLGEENATEILRVLNVFDDVFAVLVAVTVTLVEEETAGAVNKPAEEIEPDDAVQVTPVFVVP